MIPTSKDCVMTAAVWVGDEADMSVLVDELDEQATISLGGNLEIVLGGQALKRLEALVAVALQRICGDDRAAQET